MYVRVRACVRVSAKHFLGIKILITGSALSSWGSKCRPSQRQWARRYALPFDGGRRGGGEQEIRGEYRDTTEERGGKRNARCKEQGEVLWRLLEGLKVGGGVEAGAHVRRGAVSGLCNSNDGDEGLSLH